MISLNTDWELPIETLRGVGEKRAQLYHKLEIHSVGDLLYHFPRRYTDYSSPTPISQVPLGESATIAAKITQISAPLRLRAGNTLYRATATDELGQSFQIVFFNNPYALRYPKVGENYRFYGKITGSYKKPEITSPTFIPYDDPQKLRPIYPQTAGLTSYQIAKDVKIAYDLLKDSIPETLPDDFRLEHQLCRREYAFYAIHFPAGAFECEVARRRLAFEELLAFQLALYSLRNEELKASTFVFPKNHDLLKEISLPFSLTGAQRRVLLECLTDLESGAVMNRLIQGDVGSGKTMIPLFLSFMMARSDWQSAIMAPTEILAHQHLQTFEKFLAPLGISCVLITGSMTAKERRLADEALASGEVDIAIGTHALISEKRTFKALGLVVTDEQHRFGVRQRALLSQKGEWPHTLVMSATPIPRTLALMLYGDLQISVLDELPPGRGGIETFLIDGTKRQRALGFLKKHLDQGEAAYIVCPLVEEGDGAMDSVKSVEKYSEELRQTILKGYDVGLLHGRMKSKEKEKIMSDFSSGALQVLVSTTVIEVGVDVPRATIMMVENAERFGLSQLHQLRGRIGRGSAPSFCILVSDTQNIDTKKRLHILTQTQDGFKLAEEDLKLRGPGDFLGQRQHGTPIFKVADFFGDVALFKEITAVASRLQGDGALETPAYAALMEQVQQLVENINQSTIN